MKKYFVSSISYYYDHLVWCVQKAKMISIAEITFRICTDWVVFVVHNPIVWAVFFGEVMLKIVFVHILEQFERHSKWDWNRIFFDGLRIHLGLSCLYNPINNASRVLFLFILFACTVFTITISSTVLEFIILPILGPQVESVQEIISEQFTLVGGRFELLKMAEQIEVN